MPDVRFALNALENWAVIQRTLQELYVALDDLQDYMEDELGAVLLPFAPVW